MPPAIAPALLLDEEETLAEVVAVPVGSLLEGLLADGNVNRPPPEQVVALSAEILKVLFVTPKVVRVPLVVSENIFNENPEPVGKDGLPGAQEGVKISISLVMLTPGAIIPCAVNKSWIGWNVSLLLCNSWILTKVGSLAL